MRSSVSFLLNRMQASGSVTPYCNCGLGDRACFSIFHRRAGASPWVVRPAAVSSAEGGPKWSKLRLCPAMPASSLPSGAGPYLRPCFAAVYSNGSIVLQGGRHSGFTPGHTLRFNSQICPPPSRAETCPQSARRRNPARPSITFLLGPADRPSESDLFISRSLENSASTLITSRLNLSRNSTLVTYLF